MLDSLKKQTKEGSFLERVGGTIFNVGETKACHVELDGLEADLVSEVSSKEAEQVFSSGDARSSLGAAKVGVLVDASPKGAMGWCGKPTVQVRSMRRRNKVRPAGIIRQAKFNLPIMERRYHLQHFLCEDHH